MKAGRQRVAADFPARRMPAPRNLAGLFRARLEWLNLQGEKVIPIEPERLQALRDRFHLAISAASAELQNFADSLSSESFAAASSEYLREFGHLPGSNRTSRLRKKRRAIVMRWYYANRTNLS